MHSVVSTGLRRLIDKAEIDSHKPESHKLAVGGSLPREPGTDALRVKFGFKAPVAMTFWHPIGPALCPILSCYTLSVTAGISLSAPIRGLYKNFYRDMYGGNDPKSQEKLLRKDNKVKAMQLWSDWNMQLREWSVRQADSLRGKASTSATFTYMSVHTEDLVSEDLQVRYSAISSLAKWVGSTLSQEAICCLAQTDTTFMGSHDRTQRKNVKNQAREVSRRYGKWRSLVSHNQGSV